VDEKVPPLKRNIQEQFIANMQRQIIKLALLLFILGPHIKNEKKRKYKKIEKNIVRN
jgi:hypothetical protein